MSLYRDRQDAGRQLAAALSHYAGRDDVVVLALPRGGVPVAYEVASALGAPLDVLIVRKLGAPGRPELAMGAVASGGVRILNDDVVQGLWISEEAIEATAERELGEVERRERTYRGDRPPLEVAGRTVVVIDDGLATGATMRAGLAALRARDPGRVVAAVPTASPDSCARVRREADELVVLATPEPYIAVGAWYRDFTQTSDEEVRELLERARASQPARQPAG